MNMIDALCAIQPVSVEARAALSSCISEQSYPKGYQLLQLHQVSYHFYFIVKGAGRVYYLRDGLDITDYIALDNHFIGGVESLFTKQASQKAIELTEVSVIHSLLYSDFEKLCGQYHDIERLGRKMAVYAFLECQKRIEDIRFLSAAERYQQLEIKYPGISNRVPLKHIASYLGTTQVSLSRIRSGMQ